LNFLTAPTCHLTFAAWSVHVLLVSIWLRPVTSSLQLSAYLLDAPMATAATHPSTFPLFSILAGELRNQIWRHALPKDIGPVLYFFKHGCWGARRRTADEYRYDAENDDNNLVCEWRDDLLDDSQFKMPMVLVNRKARGIALDWMEEQGIKTRLGEKGQQRLLVRSFDKTRDVLYVGLDKWIGFL
jgi:hypothetical protein